MKRFLVAASWLALAACGIKSSTTPDLPGTGLADVVMVEGPNFFESELNFGFEGMVRNVGGRTAYYTKVYIYLWDANGTLVDQDYTYADDDALAANESSTWKVTFYDDDGKLRDKIIVDKSTYDIQWAQY